MYCFHTYRRTLQILKEKEDHLQKPYHGFNVLNMNKEHNIKTKYTYMNKEVGILNHIFNHLDFVLSYLLCENDIFEESLNRTVIADFFEICYINGVSDNYEHNEKQYEGDDFQDIFEKYHYSRFPKIEDLQSFVESLNNIELIRVMSLISWYIGSDNIQLEEKDLTNDTNKIYDINRLIQLNEQIIGYMENKEMTEEKKRLLNFCFNFYLKHKKEDRVLGLIQHYPINIFILTDRHLKFLYEESMSKIMYELICNQYFGIYDIEDLLKKYKSTPTIIYSSIQYRMKHEKIDRDFEDGNEDGLPEEDEDEEKKEKKKQIYIFIHNVEFLDLVESKENEENNEGIIQYFQQYPDIIFKIPIHYMYYFIKNPDILLYMLEHNLIHRRVQLFIYIFKYSTPELFFKIKKYISFNFYCKFDWDIYESIDDGLIPDKESYKMKKSCFSKEKKEIRNKEVKSHIPNFLSLQMKNMIMTYLCK